MDFLLGVKGIVTVLLGMICLAIVLRAHPRSLQWGLTLWVLSFAIGMRSIYLTSDLRVVPAEVLAWILALALLFGRFTVGGGGVRKLQMSRSGWGFLTLCSLALFTGAMNGRPLDIMVEEYKLWLLALPSLWVVQNLVTYPTQLRRAVALCVVVGFLISFLGFLEFFFPSIVLPFIGYFQTRHTIQSQMGFVRADFTFWGGAYTSMFLVALVTPTMAWTQEQTLVSRRLFGVGSVLLTSWSVYQAGHRGAWLALAIGLLCYITVTKGVRRISVVPFVMAAVLLPTVFWKDLRPVYDHTVYETSVEKRLHRADSALTLMNENWLCGAGWGATGWAHSDLLQLGANVGIPALLTFAVWWSGMFRALFRCSRKEGGQQAYAGGMLGCLGAIVVILMCENAIVRPELAAPMWFLVALADQFTRLDRLPAETGAEVEEGADSGFGEQLVKHDSAGTQDPWQETFRVQA